jgi:hypothetical protein
MTEIEAENLMGNELGRQNDCESVKLIKNSKCYNWEIKLLSSSLGIEEHLTRLKFINDQLNETYGDGK